MFFLKDLPDDKTLGEFSMRYEGMDISAVKACLSLLRSGSTLLSHFEIMLGKHDLSQGRFLTLMVMNRTPDKSFNPSELAEKLGVTRPTITGLLDKLAKENLVERLHNEEDRRKISVILTDKGRKRLENMLPDYYFRIAGLMKGLSEAERAMMVELLDKIGFGLPALIKD